MKALEPWFPQRKSLLQARLEKISGLPVKRFRRKRIKSKSRAATDKLTDSVTAKSKVSSIRRRNMFAVDFRPMWQARGTNSV